MASARKIAWRRASRRGYAAVVAKRRRRGCAPDLEAVLAQLRSADEDARVKALHRVCPCAAGFLVYERLRGEVRRLQKDPSPRVRAAALHVEQDACLIEELESGLDRAAEHGCTATRTGCGRTVGARRPGTGCHCDRGAVKGWQARCYLWWLAVMPSRTFSSAGSQCWQTSSPVSRLCPSSTTRFAGPGSPIRMMGGGSRPSRRFSAICR